MLRSLIVGPAPHSPPSARCTSSYSVVSCLPLTPPPQDHLPTWESPVSIPAYLKNVSLPSITPHYLRPTPPPLPFPPHYFRIPVAAAPLLLPKSFSTWPPVVTPQLPASTAACATPPLPRIPSTLHRPQILAKGPPTLLPPLVSFRYIIAAV